MGLLSNLLAVQIYAHTLIVYSGIAYYALASFALVALVIVVTYNILIGRYIGQVD